MRIFLFILCLNLPCISVMGQNVAGLMTVKQGVMASGIKVVLDGRVYRPSEAARLCDLCHQARYHFDQARRKRIWSFALANLGIVQSITGALNITNAQTLGAVNGALGGMWITLGAARDKVARREVKLGVDAYNRCQFIGQ